MQTDDCPKLRLLETHPFDRNGAEGLVLADPDGLFEGQVWVPRGLLPVVACFTGTATIDEIARDLTLRCGHPVAAEDVRRVAEDLDRRLCLEGERSARARREKKAAFARLAVRPAAHAGSAGYPADVAACACRLDRILGEAGAADPRPVRGLVAPHIDLDRGAAGYRAAYRALRAAPPSDLYVLFGTAHQGSSDAILIPTTKDFATPLGTVPTDAGFVGAVADRLGPDPFADELLHAQEHSLEFQVLFLRHCLGDREFRIAPFLTGRLPEDPAADGRTEGIVAAIRDEVGRRGGSGVTFVGGADLAHLGPWFGDAAPVGADLLREVDRRDRKSLDLLLAHLPDAFRADVEGDGNTRRICGTTPIYLVARLARAVDPSCTADLLTYGQAAASDGSQVVTWASVVYRGR